MIKLSKDNVAEYVKSRLDFFELDDSLQVSAIGEGSVEDDGDGFINFVWRVSNSKYHLIVKQSTVEARSKGSFDLEINRYKYEYESMQIRKLVAPDLIPDLYDIDYENRVFITEDVSYLKISRFQLIKGVMFPKIGDQIARYMAATNFYSSEYFLPAEMFRDATVYFMNHKMRHIMDNGMFLSAVDPEDTVGKPLDPAFIGFSKRIIAEPRVRLERQRLRHIFMTKMECLIHGDLHTSNVFAGPDEAKVIDMEYTWAGPFSYDLGYFTANFIAQYCTATFRPFDSEAARKEFKDYCLFVVKECYEKFCDYFCEYWDQAAKPEYQNVPGLQEDFRLTTLREFTGFAASAMLGRICNLIPYADFDAVEDIIQRHNAKCLAIIVDRQLLVNWDKYTTIEQVLDDIKMIEEIYCSNIE